MFNNDVTKTYNHLDASSEIVIMLLGAFILGSILSWIIRSLLKSDEKTDIDGNVLTNPSSHMISAPSPRQTNSARKSHTVSNQQSESLYKTPKTDDLTRITGVNHDVQKLLKEEGVNSYTDLRDIRKDILRKIKSDKNSIDLNKKIVETWPHQASIAAKGEWKKLREYQSFIQRSNNHPVPSSSDGQDVDDLKMIEGIGPKIEEVLNQKGIHSFKQLRKTDSDTLKDYIVDSDKRFDKNETESWPHQAGMAEKNQWEELSIYQEFMHAEDDIQAPPTLTNKKGFIENKETIHLSDHDDLSKIKGIDAGIEETLNKSGIYTYRQLYNSNEERIKNLLNQSKNKLDIHHQESWSHQAGMADREEWDALKIYQKFMKVNTSKSHPNDKYKNIYSISSRNSNVIDKKDDLKKIEGIGPKIEEVLNNAGINNFKGLKNSSRDMIKGLLDKAGPQYRMHEPESWPHQASLAFNGEWEKLQEYQDFLVSGRK